VPAVRTPYGIGNAGRKLDLKNQRKILEPFCAALLSLCVEFIEEAKRSWNRCKFLAFVD
jgi:hypothetical protein